MKKTMNTLGAIVIGICIVLWSCSSPASNGGSVTGNTTLTSNTLTATSTSIYSLHSTAQTNQPTAVDEDQDLQKTPVNISGKILSIDLTVVGNEKIGIGLFGHERPEIAPLDAPLYDFNLKDKTQLTSTSVSIHPDMLDTHTSGWAAISFSYIDIDFKINNITKTIRVAMATRDGMTRGDKLMKNSVSGEFQWLDIDTDSFVDERPANPSVITEIRDYDNPAFPSYNYYAINAFFPEPISLDGISAASKIKSIINYKLSNFIYLTDNKNVLETNITDKNIIKNTNFTEFVSESGESGLQATIALTITGGGPGPGADDGPDDEDDGPDE